MNSLIDDARKLRSKVVLGSLLVLLPFSSCFAASATEYILQYFTLARNYGLNDTCLISISKDLNQTGITLRNKANLLGSCGAYSYSNIDVRQQAVVNGPVLSAFNSINIGNNASVTPSYQQYIPPLFAVPPSLDLAVNQAPCNYTNLEVSSDATLEPGVYCGGLTINDANVAFKPGSYNIKNGDLKVRGNSNLTNAAPSSSLVTVMFTKGAVDEKIGNVSIVTNGQIDLPNLIIMQAAPSDGNKSNNEENEIKGAQVNFNGAFFITPDRKFSIEGSASVSNSLCMVILANTIEIGGKTSFTTGCNLQPPGSS